MSNALWSIWDTETGNIMGWYETREAAEQAMVSLIEANGPEAAQWLVMSGEEPEIDLAALRAEAAHVPVAELPAWLRERGVPIEDEE